MGKLAAARLTGQQAAATVALRIPGTHWTPGFFRDVAEEGYLVAKAGLGGDPVAACERWARMRLANS